MGAGSKEDHYIQDAGEKYAVYTLQKLATNLGKSISNSYSVQQKEFVDYCVERGITNDFDKSAYKKIYDKNLPSFLDDMINKHPNSSFDFVDVEVAYRNQGMKGDMEIVFSDGTPSKSFSLKTYKNGYGRPQLCSGTWESFLTNFLLPKAGGPGMIIDPDDNSTSYKAADNPIKRNNHLKSLGFFTNEVKEFYDWHKQTLSYVKDFYVYGDKANLWENIQDTWKSDCESLGLQAVDKMMSALQSISNNTVKQRIIKMAGLDYDEELLLLGPKDHLSSYHDTKYQSMLSRVNSNECTMDFVKNSKSLVFSFSDSQGDIIEVEIPFTLQKNGAWYIPKGEPYSGTVFHKKENMRLVYGQRRPKKSKELNTSINTYLKLDKALKQ